MFCLQNIAHTTYAFLNVFVHQAVIREKIACLHSPYILLCRDAGTRKGPGGADFVEGHRQNCNYVKIHTLEFRGSVAFFLRQILTDHILSIASAITLEY